MHLTGLLVPHMAEERISELEDISTETFKAEKQREQRQEKQQQQNKISKDCGTPMKNVT